MTGSFKRAAELLREAIAEVGRIPLASVGDRLSGGYGPTLWAQLHIAQALADKLADTEQ